LAKIEDLPSAVLENVAVSINASSGEVCVWQGYWYDTIVREYCGTAEWLVTFDDDEYFYDAQNRRINTILNALPATTGCALIPWLVFGHSDHILSPLDGMKFVWMQWNPDSGSCDSAACLEYSD